MFEFKEINILRLNTVITYLSIFNIFVLLFLRYRFNLIRYLFKYCIIYTFISSVLTFSPINFIENKCLYNSLFSNIILIKSLKSVGYIYYILFFKNLINNILFKLKKYR